MGIPYAEQTWWSYTASLWEHNDRLRERDKPDLPDPEKARRAMLAAEGHC